MRPLLLVLALLVCCCALQADPWLTVQSVTATIGPTPPEIFGERTDRLPAELLKVVIVATDDSGADHIVGDGERTMVFAGPNDDPLSKVRTNWDLEYRNDRVAEITLTLWLRPPEVRSLLEDLTARVAVQRYREELHEFSFEQEQGNWQFPLRARRPWFDIRIIGVGLGEEPQVPRRGEESEQQPWSIDVWLVGGDPTAAPTVGSVERPHLMAEAELTVLAPPDAITDVNMELDFGGFVLHSTKGRAESEPLELAASADTQRWRHHYVFAEFTEPGGQSLDPGDLPPIGAITVRLTQRIPLTEVWLPLAVEAVE